MKNPFNARAPTFDAKAIKETIRRALASAGLASGSGPMRDVTETIERALASSGLAEAPAPAAGPVIDVDARVVDVGAAGSFETHTYSSAAGARSYMLYVPARVPQEAWPMVVMLHGCTQSAADFAAGTRMNRLADRHGFLVVYPEQAAHANTSKCWNWFRPEDQARDAGEPALVAGIVNEVAARHGTDPRRIFVAGLSAGAAMAVVLGETYPELFAGVGAHSGLPYGSASDIPSALAAMKGGRSGLPSLKGLSGHQRKIATRPVPTIVFHGDRDHTVQPANGAEIARQALAAHSADAAGMPTLDASTQSADAPGGRRYSRTVHADGAGRVRVESWLLHGAGHAWSGGDARGSHTDAAGPDASAEMVRFFLALPRGV